MRPGQGSCMPHLSNKLAVQEARAMANPDKYDLDLTTAEAKGMIEDHL